MDERESIADVVGDNPLQKFLAELRARRQELDEADWTAPEPPPVSGPAYDDFRLRPLMKSQLAPLPDPITLAELRLRLPVRIHQYLGDKTAGALLLKCPPGSGKTHAMADIAQFYARRGWKGLWAASRHNMFDDLANFEHFEPGLWYHWRGLGGEIDDEPVCRHAAGQAKWLELGYPAMSLCQSLCGRFKDNWIKQCPYRAQARRREPLIFAQHQHLVTGLAIENFDFVVVDELPLKAFVEEREVPLDGLDVSASGPLATLTTMLESLCRNLGAGKRLAGRKLFDDIGPVLNDVFAQVEIGAGAIPVPPRVFSEGEVGRVPYWYIFDLLKIAAAEHRAWSEGWQQWNESIWLTSHGLHLLSRSQLWEKLPPKIVVLDATAQEDLYRILLNREVISYAPQIERRGKLYQIAGRINGKQSTLKRGELTAAGREMLDIAERLTADAKNPAVICWKAAAPHFRRRFGDDRVLTFGALRGTNALETVDVLVVAGTHTPNGSNMLDLATALSGKLAPFYRLDDAGHRQPLYRYADREYRLSPAGLACLQTQFGLEARAATKRTGYYTDQTLDAIHRQLREAELVQALHRARLNLHETIVWLITATPLQDEPLDGLWNDPPLGPGGIHWQIWLTIESWIEAQHQAGNVITHDFLAAAAGVSPNWSRRNHWLNAIAAYLPDKWTLDKLAPNGGRAPDALIPLRATSQKGGLL